MAAAAWDPWPWLLPVDGGGPFAFKEGGPRSSCSQASWIKLVDTRGPAPSTEFDGPDEESSEAKLTPRDQRDRATTESTTEEQETFEEEYSSEDEDVPYYLRKSDEDDYETYEAYTRHQYTQSSLASGKRQLKNAAPQLLVLRGLPFMASEADVAAFVEKTGSTRTLSVAGRQISLLDDALGRPSGFCVLNLASSAELQEVQRKLHMQRLGSRYIEALLPSKCEKWVASAVAQWKALGAPEGKITSAANASSTSGSMENRYPTRRYGRSGGGTDRRLRSYPSASSRY